MKYYSFFFILFFNQLIYSFSETIEEYRNRLLSRSKKMNDKYYLKNYVDNLELNNNISTKYYDCVEHFNKYVKPIQNKKNELNQKEITFIDYLEYWWDSEETEEQLLNKVCKYINNKYPKKKIRIRN